MSRRLHRRMRVAADLTIHRSLRGYDVSLAGVEIGRVVVAPKSMGGDGSWSVRISGEFDCDIVWLPSRFATMEDGLRELIRHYRLRVVRNDVPLQMGVSRTKVAA